MPAPISMTRAGGGGRSSAAPPPTLPAGQRCGRHARARGRTSVRHHPNSDGASRGSPAASRRSGRGGASAAVPPAHVAHVASTTATPSAGSNPRPSVENTCQVCTRRNGSQAAPLARSRAPSCSGSRGPQSLHLAGSRRCGGARRASSYAPSSLGCSGGSRSPHEAVRPIPGSTRPSPFIDDTASI